MIVSKRIGFTLAEVLITLGIIGIVAALTLPTLIQNYRYKQYSEQLKTSYSILSQGYGKMLADDGVTDFTETEVYGKLLADDFKTSGLEAEVFKKYFKTMVYVLYEKQVSEGWPAGNTDQTGDVCTKFVGRGSTWWLRGKTKCRGLRQQVYRLANGSVVRSGFFNLPVAENQGRLKRVVAEITIDVNGEKEPNTFGEDVFSFVLG